MLHSQILVLFSMRRVRKLLLIWRVRKFQKMFIKLCLRRQKIRHLNLRLQMFLQLKKMLLRWKLMQCQSRNNIRFFLLIKRRILKVKKRLLTVGCLLLLCPIKCLLKVLRAILEWFQSQLLKLGRNLARHLMTESMRWSLMQRKLRVIRCLIMKMR